MGDLISRHEVDEIKELMTDINGDTVYAVRMSDIRQLPSVELQERFILWLSSVTRYLHHRRCKEIPYHG